MKVHILDRDFMCGCILGQDVGMDEYTGWVVARHPDCPEHQEEVADDS